MVYKEGNSIIKILLIFVIAVLCLTVIVFLFLKANEHDTVGSGNLLNLNNIQESVLNKDIDNYLEDVVIEPDDIVNTENEDYSGFDDKGRIVIFKELSYQDENFVELCQGSDWHIGDSYDLKFVNNDYNYKIILPYTEFYNDDLIMEPYRISEDKRELSLTEIVTENDTLSLNNSYDYICGPHEAYRFFTLTVKDKTTMLEYQRQLSQVSTQIGSLNGHEALIYEDGVLLTVRHYIIFADDYTYDLAISVEAEDSLLSYLETFTFLD